MTDEVIHATMDKLVNTSMKQGHDPDDYFMEKTLARAELEKMGESISDRRFKDVCVQGFTAEYKDIKLMMHRDPTFDIEYMQSTIHHVFIEDLSRNDGAMGAIAGRGIAMAVKTSTCHNCGKKGLYARNCEVKKGSKDTAEQKWCSIHKTTSHDAECIMQGAPRPSENDNAHIASSAAVLSASSSPASDDEKPSLNFDDDFDKGFAFPELVAGSDGKDFHPNVDRITMIVDICASHHLVDDELIPRLWDSMKEYKKLNELKIIVTAGNKEVLATQLALSGDTSSIRLGSVFQFASPP